MSFFSRRIREIDGQATIEAAFLIPVMFLLLLLLIQPGILLYNQMVMNAAASEGCRLLATRTDIAGMSAEKCEGFILRRLGSVPPQENFHVHDGGCSWEITLDGDETSGTVTVTIKNQVKLLPLFDTVGSLLRLYGESGSYEQEVQVSTPTQPEWAAASEHGLNPQAWVKERL